MPRRKVREEGAEDQRPEPKPRKRPQLWQAYLIWDELVMLRKRHTLRLKAIDAGKSNMDAEIETGFLASFAAEGADGKRVKVGLDAIINNKKREMIDWGAAVGPVWDWLTSIRGLGEGSLAAQLIAQIDDIAKFSNVSKLWRFAGYAVIDGKREYNREGEKSHYNARLKSIVFLIGDQFVKQNTPLYRDLYDTEKARLRAAHPEALKENGKTLYNDGHIDMMARRKVGKIFLQHLWVVWRESEGLPTNEPYAIAILQHADLIAPSMEEVFA